MLDVAPNVDGPLGTFQVKALPISSILPCPPGVKAAASPLQVAGQHFDLGLGRRVQRLEHVVG